MESCQSEATYARGPQKESLQEEVKHNTLDHQPEMAHITTSCVQAVREDAGLEVKKELFQDFFLKKPDF